MEQTVMDAATVTSALNKIRDDLATAVDNQAEASLALRNLIIVVRPSGALTVDRMAAAVGRDRNYIDSVWSSHGATEKGKQTRVAPLGGDSEDVFKRLADAAARRVSANKAVSTLRSERDRLITMAYTLKAQDTGVKVIGPTGIAAAVGVDRNHVLRIARKAGVGPAHRTNSRNQYSN